MSAVSPRRMKILTKLALVSSLQRAVLQISGVMDLVANEEALKCERCKSISHAFLVVMDSLLDVQERCLSTMDMSEQISEQTAWPPFRDCRTVGTSSHQRPLANENENEATVEDALPLPAVTVDEIIAGAFRPSSQQAAGFQAPAQAEQLEAPALDIQQSKVCSKLLMRMKFHSAVKQQTVLISEHPVQPADCRVAENIELSQIDQIQPSSDEEGMHQHQLSQTRPWSPDVVFTVPIRPQCVPKLRLHHIALMKRRAHSRQKDSLLSLQVDSADKTPSREQKLDASEEDGCSARAQASTRVEDSARAQESTRIEGRGDLDAYLQLLMPTIWKPLRGWAVSSATQPHPSRKSNDTRATMQPAQKQGGSAEGGGKPAHQPTESETADVEDERSKITPLQSQRKELEGGAKDRKSKEPGRRQHVPVAEHVTKHVTRHVTRHEAGRGPSGEGPSLPCRHPVPRSAEEAWSNHMQRRAHLKAPSHQSCF